MQFKHPEILYALFLLIIPILVHLFQLQRFQKTPFTNVQFLKKIVLQTRKSALLKKYLILVTRMLIFTCLIFAFSQPYLSNINASKNIERTIYLDNSLSMQSKGEKGELLKSSAQQIIENLDSKNISFNLVTNNQQFKNIETSELKNALINIDYYPNSLNLPNVLLKLNSLKNNKTNSLHESILISDFHNYKNENKNVFTNVNNNFNVVKLKPTHTNNIFIDTVSIVSNSSAQITINAVLKSTKSISKNVPVSLYSEAKLIGKTSSKFKNSNKCNVQFTINNIKNFNGKITIIDDGLEFDNDFYFSISTPEKINVLSIGKPSAYLAKIYTKNEFNYSNYSIQNLNYNSIQNQHIIFLNELKNIPAELSAILIEFFTNGGDLVLIPSENTNLKSYNNFLRKLKIGNIQPKVNNEHLITSINFKHPIISNVFEKKVSNFQYPKSAFFYPVNINNSSPIITFDNRQPFIVSAKHKLSSFYCVASPLNKTVTNFSQTPLIVPILYNMVKNSYKIGELFYTIQPENEIALNIKLKKDQILKIDNGFQEFIPLQQSSQNQVIVQLQEQILKSGFYHIKNNEETIKTVAFNYNRNESYLNNLEIGDLEKNNSQISIYDSISAVFKKIDSENKINWLFKWFLTFSALFLLIEMLILKYFKI